MCPYKARDSNAEEGELVIHFFALHSVPIRTIIGLTPRILKSDERPTQMFHVEDCQPDQKADRILVYLVWQQQGS